MGWATGKTVSTRVLTLHSIRFPKGSEVPCNFLRASGEEGQRAGCHSLGPRAEEGCRAAGTLSRWGDAVTPRPACSGFAEARSEQVTQETRCCGAHRILL